MVRLQRLALLALPFIPAISAGPIAYGICQTGTLALLSFSIASTDKPQGCNAVVVACYGAAGFTFGTVTAGLGIPAAIVACNAGLGT